MKEKAVQLNRKNTLMELKELKKKIFKKENFLFLIIILIIFFSDRFSKITILNNYSDNTFYVNNFINFNLIWNTGIGFGFFSSNSPFIYNLISCIIFSIIIFLAYFSFKSDKYEKIIFSFIIGGAIGNFYDRLVYNAVPDFIDFHLENFHWFTFNVADIFITIGIFLYVLKGVFNKSL